jgi:5-dehydro-2-deoxygluconokinase
LSKEPSRSATFFAVEQARQSGATILLDMDLRADQWHDPRAYGLALRAVLPMVDIVLGTEEEVMAAVLVDKSQIQITYSQITAPEVSGDLQAAIAELLKFQPQIVVVKRGEKGCSLYPPGKERVDVPGFPVEVLNVLGAGDAFAGGFAYGLVQGWNWEKTARLANACGAMVVTRQACANAMPTLEEVEQFMARY